MSTPAKHYTTEELYALGFRLEAFGVGSQIDHGKILHVEPTGLAALLDRLALAERDLRMESAAKERLVTGLQDAAEALRLAGVQASEAMAEASKEPEPTIGDEFARMEREAKAAKAAREVFTIGQSVRVSRRGYRVHGMIGTIQRIEETEQGGTRARRVRVSVSPFSALWLDESEVSTVLDAPEPPSPHGAGGAAWGGH